MKKILIIITIFVYGNSNYPPGYPPNFNSDEIPTTFKRDHIINLDNNNFFDLTKIGFTYLL